MTNDWHFAKVDGMHGFNVAAKDHFTGARITSLVREIIQNSIDASDGSENPVRIVFSLDSIPKRLLPETTSIKGNLENCKRVAASHEKNNANAKAFFDSAIACLDDSDTIPIFGIHDFNTTGLTGSLNVYVDPNTGEQSRWKAFIEAEGWSIKSSDEAGGSFGHGKSAPFASSHLGQVLYVTDVNNSGVPQRRFIGKALLMSQMQNWDGYLANDEGEKWLSRTGYLCKDGETKSPFLDGEISNTVKDLRSNAGNGLGTSVLIPFPLFAENPEILWKSATHAVFANFYFSILKNKLEVHFPNNLVINHVSLAEEFSKYLNSLDDEDDKDQIKELQSSITIQQYDFHEEFNSANFGKIEWYLRIGGNLSSKAIGFARSTGMLITRRPQANLMAFPGMQNFDLFVCVVGKEGSELLRSLENPAHDNFEFERIGDQNKRKQAQNDFKRFASEIREILRSKAGVNVENDSFDDALADLLSGIDEEGKNKPNQKRNGVKFGTVKVKSISIPKITEPTPGNDPGGNGRTGGPNTQKNPGGSIPGAGPGESSSKRNPVEITDPRMVADSTNSNGVHISFTPTKSGSFKLSVVRAGIDQNQPIDLVCAGQRTEEIDVQLEEGSRAIFTLELENRNSNYALVPIVHEIVEVADANK